MNEEFDLKTYLRENSMDYLKAMELIKKNTNNDIVMQIISEIARLHVPELVYKYDSLSDNFEKDIRKFKTLLNKKVYLADPKSFNDPFDNKAFFYRNEVLAKYDFLKYCNGKIIDDFSNYVRLASFTSNGINNMPMWTHYSNNHRGYCVVYNTKSNKNTDLSSNLFPVQYIEERVDITPILDSFIAELVSLKEKSSITVEKIISSNSLIIGSISIYCTCLKHLSWSCEKELRCVVSSNHSEIPYLDAIPSAIYIGAKCSEMNKKHLFDIASKSNIPIYQMLFNEYSLKYELEAKQLR